MSCSEVQHTFNTCLRGGPCRLARLHCEALSLAATRRDHALWQPCYQPCAEATAKVVAHALQHLAAGIMMCAIAMELVPPMAKAKGQSSVFALVVGFSLGVAVMIGLSSSWTKWGTEGPTRERAREIWT